LVQGDFFKMPGCLLSEVRMDARDLRRLKPELDSFLERYAPLFGNEATQAHAHRFVQGLLLGSDRRNIENIAEAIDGCVVRSLQKFISQSPWPDEEIVEELQRHVSTELGDPDASLNVDETGFPKKGNKSVGVQRQYAGCLGRTDNCQIGVFVNYRSAAGHTLIDRRLFLPQEWASDGPRRAEAGVPAEVVFRTKPELAVEMVSLAAERGVPFRWVTADSVYGDSPKFVQGIRALDKYYVVDSTADARVWLEEPEVIPAGSRMPSGQRTVKVKATTKPQRVDEVVANLPNTAWKVVVVAEGSQGPRRFEYAELWVWFSEEGVPSGRERLLVRRSLGQKAEIKYHRSNAPAAIPMAKLAQVRGGHWSVEQSFQAGKGECGLDEYETRGWVGWHHHITLAMLSLWFLGLQRRRLGEKRAADDGSRSASPARSPSGSAPMGRKGNPALVGASAQA
jgi:SRSO17 transposase